MGDLKVSGDVESEPLAGETYILNGKISSEVSEVWIEDSNGNIIGDKIIKNH